MKTKKYILILIITILIYSCVDSLDNEYYRLGSKIEEYKINSKYETPLVGYFTRLDSLTSILLNRNEKIDLKTFRLFKSLVITKSISDSIKEIIIENLDFDSNAIDNKKLINKIKIVRNIYATSLVNYFESIEKDNTFNEIILHNYYSNINDTSYLNAELFIPTAEMSSLKVIMESDAQWTDLDWGGLGLRVPNKQGIDTISVEIKWFDIKLNDTINKTIIVRGK